MCCCERGEKDIYSVGSFPSKRSYQGCEADEGSAGGPGYHGLRGMSEWWKSRMICMIGNRGYGDFERFSWL